MVLQHTVHKTVLFTMLLQPHIHRTMFFTMILQHAVAAMVDTATGATGRVLAFLPTRATQNLQGKVDLQTVQYMSIYFWPPAVEQGLAALNKRRTLT